MQLIHIVSHVTLVTEEVCVKKSVAYMKLNFKILAELFAVFALGFYQSLTSHFPKFYLRGRLGGTTGAADVSLGTSLSCRNFSL